MASRAAATSGTWLRHFLLEMRVATHRAAHSVEPPLGIEVTDTSMMLPLHVVTDCNSLHETVIKSRLPEDKRAAIEVLAIREMVLDEQLGCSSDDEVEADSGRLKERNLANVYHWCVSEDQRADMLTKKSLGYQRREWMTTNNYLSIRSAKRTDEILRKAIPSRPRQRVDKDIATRILAHKDTAARAAGYHVPPSSSSINAASTSDVDRSSTTYGTADDTTSRRRRTATGVDYQPAATADTTHRRRRVATGVDYQPTPGALRSSCSSSRRKTRQVSFQETSL